MVNDNHILAVPVLMPLAQRQRIKPLFVKYQQISLIARTLGLSRASVIQWFKGARHNMEVQREVQARVSDLIQRDRREFLEVQKGIQEYARAG